MQQIIDFLTTPFFSVIGTFSTLIMLCGLLYVGYLVAKGVLPVLYRLGLSLSSRKIAIFSKDRFHELKEVLSDSGLFCKKNIVQINKESWKKAEEMSVYLVHYAYCKDIIDDILKLKKDYCSMIVYAPKSEGDIEEEVYKKLNSERNVTVVNMGGRLLSDVFFSMIATRDAK